MPSEKNLMERRLRGAEYVILRREIRVGDEAVRPQLGSQGASAVALVRRCAGETVPDSARSSPHDWEGATLVASATRVAAAC
jgi:hypothetical protein